MRIDERKENILDFIVRDFIKTAEPVSSGRVFSRKASGASPATIRNIMLELNEDGFLYQPHTSAGRAPTDKGYRYFVDNLMELKDPSSQIQRDLDRIVSGLKNEIENSFIELSRTLADHLKLFSGAGALNYRDKFFGYGLSEVLREPEFDEHNLAAEFADYVENIKDELAESAPRDLDLTPEVSLGGFGTVKIFFEDEDLGRCVLFLAGPKRMNYEKATSVLKYAAKDIKNKKTKKHGR